MLDLRCEFSDALVLSVEQLFKCLRMLRFQAGCRTLRGHWKQVLDVHLFVPSSAGCPHSAICLFSKSPFIVCAYCVCTRRSTIDYSGEE